MLSPNHWKNCYVYQVMVTIYIQMMCSAKRLKFKYNYQMNPNKKIFVYL